MLKLKGTKIEDPRKYKSIKFFRLPRDSGSSPVKSFAEMILKSKQG